MDSNAPDRAVDLLLLSIVEVVLADDFVIVLLDDLQCDEVSDETLDCLDFRRGCCTPMIISL